MPVYTFKCRLCGIQFDKFCHFDCDFSKIRCPKGHLQTQRIFSPPTIVFKGSGFYTTDNRTTKPD
ncbi:MAG: FmdB family zinc ribbon protein [Anaerolineales bacterium]